MDIKKPKKAHFRYHGKVVNIVVKETAYVNGYKVVRLIINHQQYWFLNDLKSCKLVSDQSIDKGLKSMVLKQIKVHSS